jgi:hypothetical protein
MTKLERITRDAQSTANRTGLAMAVFNLNRVGSALYVIREADSFPDENRLVAGPFGPTEDDSDI